MMWLFTLLVAASVPPVARAENAAPPDSLSLLFRASFGTFKDAAAIAVDPLGSVYVVDRGTQTLQKFVGGSLALSIGGYGWGDAEFSDPRDVSVPSGLDIFVADYANHRVQRYDRKLGLVSTLSTWLDTGPDHFGFPLSVTVSPSGELYVIDGENSRIMKFAPDGTFELSFGGYDAGAGRLEHPERIRLQSDRLVLVADDDRVLLFDPMGNFVREYGKGFFHRVRGITASDSTVYVLDDSSITAGDPVQGVMTWRIELRSVPEKVEWETAVDAAVLGRILYLLTNRRVLMFEVPA